VRELQARDRPPGAAQHHLERIAKHQNRDPEELWRPARLTNSELAEDPLGADPENSASLVWPDRCWPGPSE
jgi:hypothetical protein